MKHVTVTFSNGHVDVYKGKRPVKAAWMITLPNGAIESGHSISVAAARKTAEAATTGRAEHAPSNKGMKVCHTRAWYEKVAKQRGFANAVAFKKWCHEQNAAYKAQCKIEIIVL